MLACRGESGYQRGMGKSKRTPVLAAGGIVIREGAQPLLAIVQRRRDGAWVLPKGKLKLNEKPVAAAKREVIEETGCDVRVHEFLGVISYLAGSGPKLAHFWRMQPVGGVARELADDIKAVEWLPLPAAIDRLSLSHEQVFLRNVGHHALRRALEKARLRPLRPETVSPPVTAREAAEPPGTISPPRLGVLARFAKRWQAAMGWTERTG